MLIPKKFCKNQHLKIAIQNLEIDRHVLTKFLLWNVINNDIELLKLNINLKLNIKFINLNSCYYYIEFIIRQISNFFGNFEK